MKKITSLLRNHIPLVTVIGVFTLCITVAAVAQKKDGESVKVKIVKVVDGDTTTIEKTMDEAGVEDFTKQFQNIKGGNVQVMITVESLNKDKKEKQKSAQSMNFNFNMDSSAAHAFAKCLVLSDSGKCKKLVWNDTVLKCFPKDFDFRFDFDEHDFMNDFNFDFDIDTKEDGKTVIVKSKNGHTIVINGGEDNVTVNESENEGGKTKIRTKTIVIDEANKKKKKVIVSTSVTVIDIDEKGNNPSRSEKKKANDETGMNFYPNPSDGNFTLELDLDGKEPAQVRITDISGKEVYSEKITGSGKVAKNLNLDGRKGTFIVTIKQGNKTTNKKIIIE